MTQATGAAIKPMKATTEPTAPWNRAPSAMVMFMILPPGRNWQRPRVSVNSAAVSQRFCSTIMRRAHGSTPPKPYMPTDRNPRNRPNSDGGAGVPDMAVGYFALRHGTNPAAHRRSAVLSVGGRGRRAGGVQRGATRHGADRLV